MGMALQNHADFCVCNINKASWKDKHKQVMHVHTHPINLAFQSHTRKMIAASLDHGIKHESCQVCWNLESAGGQSQRQIYNKKFGKVESLPDQPRVLIIKPGNTCNFACRMCNPMTSSSWYADGYKLERSGLTSNSWYNHEHQTQAALITYNEYTRTFENIRNSFNRDHIEFWDTLKSWIQNLVYIDIYGGEPFLIPALFDLLEHGVKIGASHDVELNLHTNASVYNQHYLDILSHYKKVGFHVSLDSDDARELEYIRHHADFAQVSENTSKFKQFVTQHSNFEINVVCTITPLNVFAVDRIHSNLEKNYNLPVGINIVTTPEYDIRHLPQPIKTYLINNIQDPLIKNFLEQTIPGCDVEWPKFCQATDLLDSLRKQSFSKTFPEWWKLLEPYWIYKHDN
jgi:organic radical activating enzyme